MSTNPDFFFTPARTDLEPRFREALLERDREIEDYLNRHVIRRRRAQSIVGNGSDHSSTTYIDVAPPVTLTFPKATDRSVLLVRVDARGQITAAAAACWVTFAVNDGTTDYGIASADLGGTGYLSANAEVEVTGIARGPVTFTLRVKVNAGTTTWTSLAHSSLSITCTEVHAP